MASFTSEISTFNPYIQQIPESYHNVGLIKQKAFDEGVQTTQNYISSIAGLEVLKPEHKDYLNRRVNELTTSLNKLPTGTDFSEQSLINQVGGYASRLAGDPIIQNAVASTANHKKQLQYIEDEKKKGTDTTRNEWDYYKQLNQWMSDGDIKSSFNGRFSPVVDVMGEFYKAFKEAHPDSTLTQDAFRVGPNGKIELNEAMEEITREGIDPKKVQSIANTVFSRADIKNQIRIDGQYAYRGFDQEGLANSVRKNYQQAIDNTNTDVQEMRTQMATDKTVDKVLLSRKIKERIDAGAKLTEDYKQYAGLIASDPESAKVALYQNNLTSNLMNSFSWSKGSQKIVDNPLFKAKMDMLNYNLQTSKFEWDVKKDKADLQIKEAQLQIDKEKLSIEKNKAKNGGADVSTQTVYGNVPEEEGKLGESTFTESLNSIKGQYSNETAKYVNMLAADGQQPNPKKLVDGQYVWNIGPGGYTDKAAAEKAYDSLFKDATEKYTAGKGSHIVNSMMAATDPLLRQINNMETKKKEIEESYNKEAGVVDKQVQGKVSQLKDIKWTLDIPNDENAPLGTVNTKNISISPKEILNAINGVKGGNLTAEYDKRGSVSFHYKVGDKVIDIDSSTQPALYSVLLGRESQIKSYLPKGSQNLYSQAILNKEQAYKNAQSAYVPSNTAILTPKTEDRLIVNQTFANVLSSLAQGNNSGQIKNLLEWTGDGKKPGDKIDQNTYGVRYDRASNRTYAWIQRGGEKREVEVPKNLAQQLPGISLSDPFWDKHGADLDVSGNTTTDVRHVGELSAYMVPTLPNSQYSVKYHLVGDGSGKYSMKLYIRDKNGNIVLDGQSYNPPNLTGLMDGTQIMTAIQTLQSDAVIQGLINLNSKK